MTDTSVTHPAPIAARGDNDSLAIEPLIERARAYTEAAVPPNTLRAYAASWRSFTDFCTARYLEPLPAAPQTVALYVAERAELCAVSTIRQNLAAIASKHAENGLESPCGHEVVRRIVRGIARTKGTAARRKTAITIDPLRAMLLATRGSELKIARDRAIILLGFAAALRRSELADLNVEDLQWSRKGLQIIVRRSKTDQTGQGAEIAIPFVATESLCAARAVRAWLDVADIKSGPLFRSFDLQSRLLDRRIGGRDVANLVKTLASRAHLDGDFSGHSLRAGFATSAAQAKVSLDSIARTTRHKSSIGTHGLRQTGTSL